MSFKPVDRVSSEALEIPVEIRFKAASNVPWSTKTAAPLPAGGFVLVDTDNDRVPDTYLPGTSNFIAGQSSRLASLKPGAVGKYVEGGGQYYCHQNLDGDPTKQHCYWLCNGCQIP